MYSSWKFYLVGAMFSGAIMISSSQAAYPRLTSLDDFRPTSSKYTCSEVVGSYIKNDYPLNKAPALDAELSEKCSSEFNSVDAALMRSPFQPPNSCSPSNLRANSDYLACMKNDPRNYKLCNPLYDKLKNFDLNCRIDCRNSFKEYGLLNVKDKAICLPAIVSYDPKDGLGCDKKFVPLHGNCYYPNGFEFRFTGCLREHPGQEKMCKDYAINPIFKNGLSEDEWQALKSHFTNSVASEKHSALPDFGGNSVMADVIKVAEMTGFAQALGI